MVGIKRHVLSGVPYITMMYIGANGGFEVMYLTYGISTMFRDKPYRIYC